MTRRALFRTGRENEDELRSPRLYRGILNQAALTADVANVLTTSYETTHYARYGKDARSYSKRRSRTSWPAADR